MEALEIAYLLRMRLFESFPEVTLSVHLYNMLLK